jgi:hypothetical protein
MGTYLATGIVYKMRIQKRDMFSRRYVIKDKFPMENIVKSLQKEVNMDHYVFGEDENSIIWEIKPEMLEGSFVEFLETQFKMYNEEMNVQEVISRIKEAKTGKKIIELAKKKSLCNFKMADYILDSLSVLHATGLSDHITVNYHLMTFFIDGKIIMECYDNILHYFEKAIRLQEDKYPVVTCLKTMIAG